MRPQLDSAKTGHTGYPKPLHRLKLRCPTTPSSHCSLTYDLESRWLRKSAQACSSENFVVIYNQNS